MGIGGYILNFIGAVIRWLYGSGWRTIANKPKFMFSEYVNGPKKSKDWFDLTGHSLVNRVIGLVTIILLCWIISKLGK